MNKNKKISPSTNPAKDAREGNLEALYALANQKDANSNKHAYMWLCAAIDFAHKDIEGYLEAIASYWFATAPEDLGYENCEYEIALAHWELGLMYLEGKEALPIDYTLARKHLQQGYDTLYYTGESIEEQTTPLLARLEGDGKVVVESMLEEHLHRKVIRWIKRVDQLRRLNAPQVIIQNEEKLLQEAFDAFIQDGVK